MAFKKTGSPAGSKQVSMETKKPPSPLMSLAGAPGGGKSGSKKDYAKKPKDPMTEFGVSSFGMTGPTGES